MSDFFVAFKKVAALLLCLALILSIACSCASKTPQWKTAYLDFIEKEKDNYRTFAIVYIDNNDIPELYLSGIDEATGDCVCSYKNGNVLKQSLHRIGGGWYVEKNGYIVNKNGHMGQEHTHTYKLDEDGFELTFEALLSERAKEYLEETDEYTFDYEYSIAGKTVSEAEYNSAITANDTETDFKNAVQLNTTAVEYAAFKQLIIEYR